MSTEATRWLNSEQALHRKRFEGLRDAEIPRQHGISLGIPTRRWGDPGYAFFASPQIREAEKPLEQKAPDRWWVIDARTGKLVFYALCTVVPFASGESWGTVRVPRATESTEERSAAWKRLLSLFDPLTPDFFQGAPGDPAQRKTLSDALEAFLPATVFPQYRALAPDFFEWLAA